MFSSQFLDYQEWGRSIDDQNRIEKERKKKYNEQHQRNFEIYRKIHGNYWIGPAKVKIPLQIKRVPSLDGVNTCSYDIFGNELHVSETLIGFMGKPKWTEEEYCKKFADLQENGEWYWKTDYFNEI